MIKEFLKRFFNKFYNNLLSIIEDIKIKPNPYQNGYPFMNNTILRKIKNNNKIYILIQIFNIPSKFLKIKQIKNYVINREKKIVVIHEEITFIQLFNKFLYQLANFIINLCVWFFIFLCIMFLFTPIEK